MPPFLHSLLSVLVTLLGGAFGIGVWLLPCWKDGVKLLFGGYSFPLSFLGPVSAFFGTVLVGLLGFNALWVRYVPARCPQCRGRMTIRPGRGRDIIYACPTCG
jgi:hypothetical protein